MSGQRSYDSVASAINKLSDTQNSPGDWWGRMLSSITFAIGADAELKYVTANMADDHYEIAVIADDLIVTGTTESPSSGDADIDVKVYSLKEITHIGVSAGESYFSDGAFASWPGRIEVKFEHPSAGSFSLPYSYVGSNYSNEKLQELIPELVALIGRRG